MPRSGVESFITRAFMAEGVTRLGDAVTLVALPLVAVLVLDATPAELALIGVAQAAPVFLLSLPLGAWVDRRHRRWPLLLVADVVRAASLVLIPFAAAVDLLSLPLLLLVALTTSGFGSLFDLAHAGWLPRVLHRDDLHRANARFELARSAAMVAGPVLGGGLVAVLTAPVALLADAASFLVAGALTASVRRYEPRWNVGDGSGADEPARAGAGWRLPAGLRFIAGQPLVAAVTATAAINNLARSIALGIAVLYLVEVGGLSAGAVGLAFGLGNAGFLAGAILSRRLTRRWGMGRTMQAGVVLFGPSMLAFAAAPPALAGLAFTAMLFVHGLGIAIHNVNQLTVRQVLTPDALRGRVAAVFRMLIFGAIPAGTAVGGLVAEAAGLRAALVVSGAGLCLGVVPYAVVRIQRVRFVTDLAPTTP